MKIALCISGHLRNYKLLLSNFLEFKEYCQKFGDIDIFISTWNKFNTDKCWSGVHGDTALNSINTLVNKNDLMEDYQTSHVEIFDYDFYSSEYSPLSYPLFTTNTYNWDDRGIDNNIVHSSKMFFLIYRCNLLKLQQEYRLNKKYDLVFRLRPDIRYDSSVYRSIDYAAMSSSDKLFLTFKQNYRGAHMYDDRIAIGVSSIIDKYSSVFYNMGKIFNQNIFGDPEEILFHSLNSVLSPEKIVNIQRIGSLISETTGIAR